MKPGIWLDVDLSLCENKSHRFPQKSIINLHTYRSWDPLSSSNSNWERVIKGHEPLSFVADGDTW